VLGAHGAAPHAADPFFLHGYIRILQSGWFV